MCGAAGRGHSRLGFVERLLEGRGELRCSEFQGELLDDLLFFGVIDSCPNPALFTVHAGPEVAIRLLIDDVVVGHDFHCFLLTKEEPRHASVKPLQELGLAESALLPLAVLESEELRALHVNLLFALLACLDSVLDVQRDFGRPARHNSDLLLRHVLVVVPCRGRGGRWRGCCSRRRGWRQRRRKTAGALLVQVAEPRKAAAKGAGRSRRAEEAPRRRGA
mmetsp:Transcript_55761/g.155438  ORF Transcript_55761/g.155438 Transcript_55761/m.155438 type:complete len:220 (+) Transcript_55761:556-1215(+)